MLEPGSGKAAERNALEYSHLGFWALGSNFADVMVSKSSVAEPASGGGSGATEAYVILRSNIGLNEAIGTNTFRKGPMRNLSIELGANLEIKNSSFAPAEKTIYFGPNVRLLDKQAGPCLCRANQEGGRGHRSCRSDHAPPRSSHRR